MNNAMLIRVIYEILYVAIENFIHSYGRYKCAINVLFSPQHAKFKVI